MRIRQATMEDFRTVQYITVETIRAIYPHYYPKGAVEFFLNHHSGQNISADIALNRVFVLEKEQTMVGTITIKNNEICRLFVLPEHQGKGYGRALLDFAERAIFKENAAIVLDASLPAKMLYIKRGYKYRTSHALRTDYGDFLCYDVLEKTGGVSMTPAGLTSLRNPFTMNESNSGK